MQRATMGFALFCLKNHIDILKMEALAKKSRKEWWKISKYQFLETYKDSCSERSWRTPCGEDIEGHFCSCMLCLPQRIAVARAFEGFAIEVHTSFEPRSMIWSLSDAGIRREVEAASLRKFLQLVLIHDLPTKQTNHSEGGNHLVLLKKKLIVEAKSSETWRNLNERRVLRTRYFLVAARSLHWLVFFALGNNK